VVVREFTTSGYPVTEVLEGNDRVGTVSLGTRDGLVVRSGYAGGVRAASGGLSPQARSWPAFGGTASGVISISTSSYGLPSTTAARGNRRTSPNPQRL